MNSILLNKWISFLVFLFGVSVLSLPGHGGQSVIMLILTMFYVALSKHKDHNDYSLNNEEKFFFYSALVWFGWQFFSVLYQPLGYEFKDIETQLRALDNMSRWLLLLPVFFISRRYLINWKLLSLGIGIGVLITVSVAHYEVYFLNIIRAEGMSNQVIPFGELMVVSDLLLFIFTVFTWKKDYKILSYCLLFASTVAFYGSLLSATRGAWLVYVLIVLAWLLYAIKNIVSYKIPRFYGLILLKLLIGVIIFISLSQTYQFKVLESRTQSTLDNLSSGDYQNASSNRLIIFNDAINHIKKKPFGIGTGNFTKIDPNGYPYNAHNQLLNIWVENGIQGVISIFLLVGYLFIFFLKNLSHSNELINFYALSGLTLIASYVVFSQTQTVFDHHQVLLFFIFYLYFFFAQIQLLKRLKTS